MVKFRQYTAISGHKKRTVFPEGTQSLLSSLGAGLYKRPSLSSQLAAYRTALQQLSPYSYRRAASDIRGFANLYQYGVWLRPLPRWNVIARVQRGLAASAQHRNFDRKLQNETDLPFLLLFDGNGYNREFALSRVSGPLRSPIEVIALADLANNWVAPVRKAALSAIDRSYSETDPKVLAASFSFFAENRSFWKRWDNQASEHVMSFFHAPDVMVVLAKRLVEGIEPRGSATLSFALQTENFDLHLERILKTSRNSAIRAHALRFLLNGEAVWKTGYTWQWTNKSLGERKRVAALSRRKLSIQPLVEPMLIAAIGDKSAQIRRIAAQSVIDHGAKLNLPMADITQKLVSDVNPSVRRRGEYLARKMAFD